MKTPRFLLAVLSLTVSLVLPHSAGAQIVIDSFVTPQSAAGGALIRNTAIGSGILGGERDLLSFLTMSVSGTAPYRLNVSCPADLPGGAGGDLTYDGVDHDASSSSFGGLGSVDLTGGGLYNRISFAVSGMNSYSTSHLWIYVRQFGLSSFYAMDLPRTPGIVDVPFSAFARESSIIFSGPVDFRNVGYLEFHFETTAGASFELGPIMAVPEPSVLALLLCAASACLALSKRRS